MELKTLSAMAVPEGTTPCSESLIEMSAALVAANSSFTNPAMYAKLPYDVAKRACNPVASAIVLSTFDVTSVSVGEFGFLRSRLHAASIVAATTRAQCFRLRIGVSATQ